MLACVLAVLADSCCCCSLARLLSYAVRARLLAEIAYFLLSPMYTCVCMCACLYTYLYMTIYIYVFLCLRSALNIHRRELGATETVAGEKGR